MYKKQYMSAKETAEVLGVHKSTIFKLCKAGKLPHIMFGRSYRIPIEKCIARLKEMEQGN